MKKCGQDCAVICETCKHYKSGTCVKDGHASAVDRYDYCGDFHCKRVKD